MCKFKYYQLCLSLSVEKSIENTIKKDLYSLFYFAIMKIPLFSFFMEIPHFLFNEVNLVARGIEGNLFLFPFQAIILHLLLF